MAIWSSVSGGIKLANKTFDAVKNFITGRRRKKAREESEEDNEEIRKAAREGDVDKLNEKLGHKD